MMDFMSYSILIDHRCTVHVLYFRVEMENNAFLFQYGLYAGGNIPVFAANQFGIPFEYRHLRTERGIHGSKFQADIASTHNHQPFGKFFQFHDGSAGVYAGILFYSINRWYDGFRTGIYKDLRRLQFNYFCLRPHFYHIRTGKRSDTCIHRHIRIISQIMIILIPQERSHLFFTTNGLTIIILLLFPRSLYRSFLSQMYQRLCRNTADIDTRASIHTIRTFYYGNRLLTFCKFGSQGLPTLAETNDNGIILFHIFIFLIVPVRSSHCLLI